MSGSPSDAEGDLVRDQGMCVACLCVSSTSTFCDCSVERMAWHIYGLELYCFVDEICFLLKWPCRVFCGLLTELRDGSVHLGRGAPFGVELLDLSGRDRLVGLASGTIHGLDPQDAVLFIVAGKHHSVAFFHRVEEGPPSIKAWDSIVLDGSRRQRFTVTKCPCLTCLGITVVHSVAVQLEELLRFGLFLSVAAHGECILTHLHAKRDQ